MKTFAKVFLSIVLAILAMVLAGRILYLMGIASLVAVPIALLALVICIGIGIYKLLDRLF